MSTEPKSRREEYAQLTRQALIAAGAERISRQGYAETSIAQIADDARVSKGAFYHHFPDKQSLLKAVLTAACDHSAEAIKATIDANSGGENLVSAALDSAMQAIQHDSQYRELRQQAAGVLPVAERRELDDRIRVPLVESIFARLRSEGQLRDDIDVDAATVLVVAVLEATLEEMTASDDPQGCYTHYRPILLGFIDSLRPAAV